MEGERFKLNPVPQKKREKLLSGQEMIHRV